MTEGYDHYRDVREEAWRLYEAWLNGEPTGVDLTEEGSDDAPRLVDSRPPR